MYKKLTIFGIVASYFNTKTRSILYLYALSLLETEDQSVNIMLFQSLFIKSLNAE